MVEGVVMLWLRREIRYFIVDHMLLYRAGSLILAILAGRFSLITNSC